MIASTLGVLAIISSIVRSWPQVVRILRRRSTAGVSVLTWSLVFSCSTSWVIWGIGASVAPTAISNAAVAFGALAILAAVYRQSGGVFGTFLRVFIATMAANVVAIAIAGVNGCGAVAVAMAIVMFLPQAWTALHADISGVSPMAWTLIMVSSLLWGIYGFVIHKLTLVPGTFVIVPAALVVLSRAVFASRSEARDLVTSTA